MDSVTRLERALQERVLLMNMSPGNPALRGMDDPSHPNLNITHRELVLAWANELVEAGTDIVETRSFGAHPFVAEHYGRADRALRRDWNEAAVKIARQAAGAERFVVGAVGEGGDLLPSYAEQVRDLWTGGVDAIHLACFFDSRNLSAALSAVAAVEDELACRISTIITFDVEPAGMLISGERPEDLWGMMRDYRPIALGLITYGRWQEMVRRLRDVTGIPVGLLVDPCPWAPPSMTENRPIEWLAESLQELLDERLLHFCGLSCTVPSIDYVKAVAGLIRNAPSVPR